MKNIIVLDNKPYIIDRIKDLVEKYDIRVYEAVNSVQFFNILSQIGYNVELVITEINLGKESGIDVIKKLKEKKIDIPVLILTSENRRKMFARGIKAGAMDYILKPFEGEFLLKRIVGDIQKGKDKIYIKEVLENTNRANIEFEEYLHKQLEEAKELQSNYAILMITLIKSVDEFTEKVEKEYSVLCEDIHPKLVETFPEVNMITKHGFQSFAGTTNLSNGISEESISKKLDELFSDVKKKDSRYSDYYLECVFAKYPKDGHTKEELMSNVKGKTIDKINSIKKVKKK